MKKCPKCGQAYSDPGLNFCLNDGELLMQQQDAYAPPRFEPPTQYADDDPPPTVLMSDARETNPTGWQPSESLPAQWQGQQIVTPPGHSPVQYANFATPNPTLGIISLILGVSSLISVCCSLGIVFNVAAIVTGIIALVLNKKDPQAHGGRGFAIGGIAIGGLLLLFYILFIIIYGLAALGGAIG